MSINLFTEKQLERNEFFSQKRSPLQIAAAKEAINCVMWMGAFFNSLRDRVTEMQQISQEVADLLSHGQVNEAAQRVFRIREHYPELTKRLMREINAASVRMDSRLSNTVRFFRRIDELLAISPMDAFRYVLAVENMGCRNETLISIGLERIVRDLCKFHRRGRMERLLEAQNIMTAIPTQSIRTQASVYVIKTLLEEIVARDGGPCEDILERLQVLFSYIPDVETVRSYKISILYKLLASGNIDRVLSIVNHWQDIELKSKILFEVVRYLSSPLECANNSKERLKIACDFDIARARDIAQDIPDPTIRQLALNHCDNQQPQKLNHKIKK